MGIYICIHKILSLISEYSFLAHGFPSRLIVPNDSVLSVVNVYSSLVYCGNV